MLNLLEYYGYGKLSVKLKLRCFFFFKKSYWEGLNSKYFLFFSDC